MARKLRVQYEGAIYHIMIGVTGERTFTTRMRIAQASARRDDNDVGMDMQAALLTEA